MIQKEQIDRLADSLGKQAEVGLHDIFQPWLNQGATSSLDASISHVGYAVACAFREALVTKLVPEFQRVLSGQGHGVVLSDLNMGPALDPSQMTPKATATMAPTTPDNGIGASSGAMSSQSSTPVSSDSGGSSLSVTPPVATGGSQENEQLQQGARELGLLPNNIFEESSDPSNRQETDEQMALPASAKSKRLQDSSSGSFGSAQPQSQSSGASASPLHPQLQRRSLNELQDQQGQRRTYTMHEQQQQQQEQNRSVFSTYDPQQQQQFPRRSLGTFEPGGSPDPHSSSPHAMNSPGMMSSAISGPTLTAFTPDVNGKKPNLRRFSCDVPTQQYGAFRGLTVASPQQQHMGLDSSSGPGQSSEAAAAAMMAAAVQQHLQQQHQNLLQQQLLQSHASCPQTAFNSLLSLAGQQQQQQQQQGSFQMPTEQDLFAMLQQSMGQGGGGQGVDMGGLLGSPAASSASPGFHNLRPNPLGMVPNPMSMNISSYRSLPATPAGVRSALDMFQPEQQQHSHGGADQGHMNATGGLLSVTLHAQQQQDHQDAAMAAMTPRAREQFALSSDGSGLRGSDRRNMPSISDLLLRSPSTIMENQAVDDNNPNSCSGTPTRQDLDYLRHSNHFHSSPMKENIGYQHPASSLLRTSSAAAAFGTSGVSSGGSRSNYPGAGNSPMEPPVRFKVLPEVVQGRIMNLITVTNSVISVRDFDEKVVNKVSILVDMYGAEEALTMLAHLEHRMRTKQGQMKNGPGYLDVAVSSHLDMLKAQGSCPKNMTTEEYAAHALSPPVLHELKEAVANNKWLEWDHLDQGIIQLIKKLPRDSAVEKLQEISYHSFKNVDNIKGCIMSILNSKIREDRRRQ